MKNFNGYVRWITGGFFLLLVEISFPNLAFSAQEYDSVCIQKALKESAPETTIEQIRQACLASSTQTKGLSAVKAESDVEPHSNDNQFSIQPYRPIYVLFGTYNFSGTNEQLFRGEALVDDPSYEPYEVKFQISLKVPVADQLLGLNDHLFVAYTNRSFWQAYNSKISKPFRETNHEPEIWMGFDTDWAIGGWRNQLIDLGFVHQSNGRLEGASRSWDRAYLRLFFEKDNSVLMIKPWLRLPESSGQDDNPDMMHYMGNAEVEYVTKANRHQFRVLVRNNLDTQDNKGAFELGYSFLIHRNLNVYAQWFYGYGESLIDYNYKNNTVSLGVSLGDWF